MKNPTRDKNHNLVHFLTLHGEGCRPVVTSSLVSAIKALVYQNLHSNIVKKNFQKKKKFLGKKWFYHN